MICSPLVILGGTFDPPHLGHLQLLARLQGLWSESIEMTLLPTFQPVHKAKAQASVVQRTKMLQYFAEMASVSVDWREIRAKRPCYTLDSLTQIRAEQAKQRPIVFIMGGDSFSQLHHWHGYQQLLSLAHILWFPRAGQAGISGPQQHWPVAEPCHALSKPSGLLLHLQFCPSAIASSQIRQQPDLGYAWLPEPIFKYCQQHRIYS